MSDQTPRPDLNGQLLRLEPNGDLFFVLKGRRCRLGDGGFKNLFRSTIDPMTLPRMGSVPEGEMIGPEAELVQTPDGVVYLVCQGMRREVSHRAFVASGFDWEKVIGIPAALVNLPPGPPISFTDDAT